MTEEGGTEEAGGRTARPRWLPRRPLKIIEFLPESCTRTRAMRRAVYTDFTTADSSREVHDRVDGRLNSVMCRRPAGFQF